jgi:hypothetical protein
VTDDLVLRRHIAVIEAANRRLAALIAALGERFPLIKERMGKRVPEGEEMTPAAFAALVEEAIRATPSSPGRDNSTE